MAIFPQQTRNVSLDLQKNSDLELIAGLCSALGSPVRLRIVVYIQQCYVCKISQMSSDLSIPMTTLMHHLEKLEEAGIIIIYYKYSKHASTRMVARQMRSVSINLFFDTHDSPKLEPSFVQNLGVGCYADYSGESIFIVADNAEARYFPDNNFPEERFSSQLIFTSNGVITYHFSNSEAKRSDIQEVSFSFEICSEAPYYDNTYLSDITFWINEIELATHTLVGDFGDRRGKLNPEWWPAVNTQYGLLMNLTVNKGGVYINGELVNPSIKVRDLMLEKGNKLVFTFGNKNTAEHCGGFNLFGREFGDFAQDICMTMISECKKQ